MGTYADLEIEREQREYGQRMMAESLREHDLHQARPPRNVRAIVRGGPTDALLPSLTAIVWHDGTLVAFAESRACTVRTPSPHHVQLMNDGSVVAEWWPSKGTTVMNQKRGPVCRTAAEFVAWVKEATDGTE